VRSHSTVSTHWLKTAEGWVVMSVISSWAAVKVWRRWVALWYREAAWWRSWSMICTRVIGEGR